MRDDRAGAPNAAKAERRGFGIMSDDKYTESELREIFYAEHDDFEPKEIAEFDEGSRRWHHDYTRIFRHKDGSLWALNGSIGLTEMQEDEFFDQPYKVEAREETIPAKPATAYYTTDGRLVGMVIKDKTDSASALSFVADGRWVLVYRHDQAQPSPEHMRVADLVIMVDVAKGTATVVKSHNPDALPNSSS